MKREPPVFGMLRRTHCSASAGDLVWDVSHVALLMSLKGFPEMKTHLRMHEEKSRRSLWVLSLKIQINLLRWTGTASCPLRDNSVTSCSQGMACASAVI